jgi:DNA-binding NarL/FixJ family response regulator
MQMGVHMDTAICVATRLPRSDVGTKTSVSVDPARQPQTEAIAYIDSQRLSRDCVSEQLAARLPEVLIEAIATAYDLSKEDAETHRFALGILNKHSMHIGETELADQLSFLATIAPDLPIALLSDVDEADEIAAAFGLGVRGYIPTSLPIKQVAEAIRLVSVGGSYLPPSILTLSAHARRAQSSPSLEEDCCDASFTPRQLEVLRRLWQGKQNKLIAYDLNMCESTVKVHIRHIMKKLNARNRTQVVLLTRSMNMNGAAVTNG